MKIVKSVTIEIEYKDGSKKTNKTEEPKKIKELFLSEKPLSRFLLVMAEGVLFRDS